MTSSGWLDDIELEAAEYDDSEAGELYDESEPDTESRASDARRRRIAQQRQRVALARARQARRSPGRMPGRPTAGRPGTTAPTPPAAAAAIRSLDLDQGVLEDRFRSAMAAASRRMSRSEYAAVAGAAVNQFIESFQAPDNPFFKAALRFSPLLLLAPQRRGTGFDGFIRDPRVVGAAAVGAITILGENRTRLVEARSIEILAPPTMVVGQQSQFIGDVFDGRGRQLDAAVTWNSGNAAVATIDNQGKLTTVGEGTTVITARSGAVLRRVLVTVAPKALPQGGTVSRIDVLGADKLSAGDKVQFIADLVDDTGAVVTGPKVEWDSTNQAVATVNESGEVNAVAAGESYITAKLGNRIRRIRLVVK